MSVFPVQEKQIKPFEHRKGCSRLCKHY